MQSAIAGVCGCNFTAGNVVGGSFSCPNELPSTAVLYRADLRGVQGVSCNELTNALGKAIESNPDLSVLGNQLDLIATCDVGVTSATSDFMCNDESGGTSIAIVAGAAVGGVLFGLLVLICLMVVFIFTRKRRKKRM